MAKIFQSVNPNKWLGRPATAQNVVPTSPCHLAFGPGTIRILGGQVNVAAAASAAGIAVALADSEWIAGEWTNSTSTYVDDTANAQSGTSDAMVLITTTQNNGLVIGSKQPANVFLLDVTTADGGSPAYDFAYWGYPTTGSQASAATWQTITGLISGVLTSTGEVLTVLHIPPAVQVKTTATVGITGFPVGLYALRMRATTAATTTAAKIARVYVGAEIIRQSQVAQHGVITLAGGVGAFSRTPTIPNGVAIGAFFATTNAGNHLYLEYE